VLDQPAQNDLRHRFAVLRTDLCQDVLVENVMLALGKRRPGFDKHAFCLQGFHLCLPLVERIDFNLVHLRHGLVENSQINGAVRGEIADANGTNAATPTRQRWSGRDQEGRRAGDGGGVLSRNSVGDRHVVVPR